MATAEQPRPERSMVPPPRPPPPPASRRAQLEEDACTEAEFVAFQRLHDKAFVAVNMGLSADEQGNTRAAEEHYKTGLKLLDKALDVDCAELQNCIQEEKDLARQMQNKMNKTRLQIGYRLEALQKDRQERGASELSPSTDSGAVRLPSYDEAVSSLGQSSVLSDAVLGDSIMNSEYPGHTERNMTEATQLFSIEEGVQVFYITAQGYVSAPSYPSALRVVKFSEPAEGDTESNSPINAPPAFLHVGDWFYPLIPGASPALHTSYGAYIFPDVSSEEPGASVGLMLPDTVSEETRHAFEDILWNLSAVEEQQVAIQPEDLTAPPEEQPQVSEVSAQQEDTTSAKISRGILIASQWISWGVGKGAEKAGELISFGSSRLREKLRPEQQPSNIDPRAQKGMVYARKATHTAVRVSGYIVNKLGEATVALGKQLAPHIREKGAKILPKSLQTKERKSSFDGVIEVAATGLQGFGTVYMSLEGAAKSLAKSLANETVSIVQHKYGEHAGKFAENTVYAAGNVAMTAYNADNLGLKAVAKRAAKDTGKAVLLDLKDRHAAGCKGEEQGLPTGACGDVSTNMGKPGEKGPL